MGICNKKEADGSYAPGAAPYQLDHKNTMSPRLNGQRLQDPEAFSHSFIGTPKFTPDMLVNSIKSALREGCRHAVSQCGAVDGFLADDRIKIMFPDSVKNVESSLRGIGMGSMCDDVVENMNRAAEQAASEALDIFQDAVMGMGVDDAKQILKGTNTECTDYLSRTCDGELRSTFRPVVTSALSKCNVIDLWDSVVSKYNALPMVPDVNFDMPLYVVEKAIAGLMTLIGEKEQALRANPKQAASQQVQKVFANLESL